MQRENIATLIHEQAHNHETQSLSFLLYFFSILHEYITENQAKNPTAIKELAQLLKDDFIDNQEFKNICIHSDNFETKAIYNEITLLASIFLLLNKESSGNTLLDIERQIQKIYDRLLKVVT